jgi:hypothetical protein
VAWHIEPELDSFARKQARAKHYRRIRRIGAGGDCGDDHRSIVNSGRDSVDGDGHTAISGRGCSTTVPGERLGVGRA